MPNDYWTGSTQARLTREQITADWGRGDHSGTAIALANRAFEIWYTGRNRIDACSDTGQRSRMLAALEDAGRSGWGLGVDDLEEAFQHLDANGGRWTDSATWNYYGGPRKVFQATLVTAPTSIVNFLNAVDCQMERLHAALDDYDNRLRELNEARAADNWSRIGEVLEQVSAQGERVVPFLWRCPTLETRVGQVVSFAGVLSNIHSGLTTYGNAIRGGMSPGQATALAALRTALGWVPVLGDFYGRAVDLIPNLSSWFRELIRERVRQIDRASQGM